MAGQVAETVQLSISLDAPSVTVPPLNSVLVAGTNAQFADRVRAYSTVAALTSDAEAQITASMYEAKALTAILAQNPTLSTVKIGRIDTSAFVAQVNTYTVAATPTDGVFSIDLDGVEVATFTASSSTNLAVAADLVADINGSSIPITASDNLDGTFTCTADAAGDGFTSVLASPNNELTQVVTTPNTGWESELALVAAEDDEFYFLCHEARTDAVIEDAAKWIAAQRKIQIAQSSAGDIITADGALPSVASRLKAQSLQRTALMYYATDADAAAEAWTGKKAAANPDSVSTTWAHATLTGITLNKITDTAQGFAHGKNANYYGTLGGLGAMWEGKMASGHYIDSIVAVDWTYFRVLADLQQVFISASNRNEKVPYTDGGLSRLAGVIRKRLAQGQTIGHFNPDVKPKVTFTRRKDAPSSDVQNRIARLSFEVELAHAIHKTVISGAVSTTLAS